MPVLFTCIFVNSLSFPRYTFYISALYLFIRVNYTQAYTSHRGYNKAMGMEEMQKLLLVLMLMSGFLSSFRLMGLRMPKFGKNAAKGVKK